MKSKLLFYFLIIGVAAKGQITPSSCMASDSIRALYRDDADRMVVRDLYATNSNWADSVPIPQDLSDTLLNKIIAIYNATSLPARDSVFLLYDIHTFPDTALQIINLHADSNLSWMQQLHLGNLNTGNTQVDNLITSGNLHLVSYSTNLSMFWWHSVRFEADTNINTYVIASSFSSIPGVFECLPEQAYGSGSDITDSTTPGFVQLTFTYGWGDCPSMCIFYHHWKFNVYPDCSVEYIGSFGNPLDFPTAVASNKLLDDFSLFPNPVTNELRIQNAKLKIESMEIYDMVGQKVLSISVPSFSSRRSLPAGQAGSLEDEGINVSALPSGIYFITIKTDQGSVLTKKFVKQ